MNNQEILKAHVKECVIITNNDSKFIVSHKLKWFKPVLCETPAQVQYIVNSWKSTILEMVERPNFQQNTNLAS
jgi:hypothetical protein